MCLLSTPGILSAERILSLAWRRVVKGWLPRRICKFVRPESGTGYFVCNGVAFDLAGNRSVTIEGHVAAQINPLSATELLNVVIYIGNSWELVA